MPRNDAVLGPKLRRAKQTLRSALDEACRADLERADTGELIRIEEVLAIANEAAKEAVSVRRRLSAEHGAMAATVEHEAAGADAQHEHSSSAREIVDERGVRWAVFAVIPSSTDSRPTVRERFRGGWLSFDCGDETRRLVPIPDGWQQLSDLELRTLWLQAEVSPRRTHSGPHPAPHAPEPPSAPSESQGSV